MKKTLTNILLLAAAITLGVSCQKETNANSADLQLEDCSVSADVLGADTKVALDGTTPKWEANDQILVLDANNKPLGGTGLFTITSGSGTNTGNFSGKKYIGQTPAYAIYPASVYDKTTGKFTLRAVQNGTKATTFKDYAVMMGTVSSGNITFANVCSILKINTGDYGMTNGEAAIKSLKVSAATTAIAGEFTPDWTNYAIAPAEGGTVSQEVTATATGEGGYDNDTDIYLALIPSASQALTFEFTNIDDEVATVSETVTPAANKIKDLGTAGGMEFKTPGPDPNYWVDLGAVTKDGHKLLFSRYNVASIDANGNATFDETLGGSGNTFTYEQAMSIKTAGGQVCRLPEKIEFISVLSDVNSSISINGNTISLTSKASGLNEIDGSLLLFCDSSTGESRYHAVDGSCCVNMSNYDDTRINYDTDKNIFCRLVTIIDENIPLLENDFEVYYQRGGMYNSVTFASNIFTPEFETSGWVTSVYLRPALVYANNYRYIEQLVSDEFRFKQDDKSWENNFYETGIRVDYEEEHTYVVENIKFKKTVTIHHTNSMCFVKGTLITLSDGSKKPIEEITYNDELKVWNFDKGCYDTAKVFWLTKSGVKTEHYYKMTFSDGTVLNVLGPQFKKGHKIYNYTDRKFEGVKTFEVGKDVFTENGIVTLVSKEEMNEEVEFYCLMTEGHMNCFTDGVLTTLLQFNNIYSIDNDMKFVKNGRKKRPYKEFKAAGISREWYNGLRLGEQTDSLDVIRKYIDRCESQMAEKPAPSLWQRFKTWWKSIFG